MEVDVVEYFGDLMLWCGLGLERLVLVLKDDLILVMLKIVVVEGGYLFKLFVLDFEWWDDFKDIIFVWNLLLRLGDGDF